MIVRVKVVVPEFDGLGDAHVGKLGAVTRCDASTGRVLFFCSQSAPGRIILRAFF